MFDFTNVPLEELILIRNHIDNEIGAREKVLFNAITDNILEIFETFNKSFPDSKLMINIPDTDITVNVFDCDITKDNFIK